MKRKILLLILAAVTVFMLSFAAVGGLARMIDSNRQLAGFYMCQGGWCPRLS